MGTERVRSADNMSLEDFEMHMNMRHSDSLGGMEHITLRPSQQYVNFCWRKFHSTIHRLRADIMHEHGPYKPERNLSEQPRYREAS